MSEFTPAPSDVDVVVIGGGPAGEVAAGRCADRGLETALVEAELVGGECSYWGCIPSKTLLRPGDVSAAARRVPGAAAAVTGPVDVGSALARRDYMTSSWDDGGQEQWLTDHGIRLLRGRGRLAGPRRVAVAGGPVVRSRSPGTRCSRRSAARASTSEPPGAHRGRRAGRRRPRDVRAQRRNKRRRAAATSRTAGATVS